MLQTLYKDGEIRFLRHFSTSRGRYVSNRLYLKGKGSEEISNRLSSYFWNFQGGLTLKKINEMKVNKSPNVYFTFCKGEYEYIINHPQYNYLPQWVKNDLTTVNNFLKYE